MTWRPGIPLRRVFNRQTGLALAWALLTVGVAVAVNVVGIRTIGSVQGWQAWLQAHATYFVAWRVALYASIAGAWWRLRARQQAWPADAKRRLLRAEIAAGAAIALVEGLRLLPAVHI